MSSNTDYNADDIALLEGLAAVRKRPGMYIGSTDNHGLAHCLWEIIDNSVDEVLAGFGNVVNITLHGDNSFSVQDFGRGIPVDIESKTGLTGVELVFTKLHAGGKFGTGAYFTSGGLHGVGASVVNALSEKLSVEVDRDGMTWVMEFRNQVTSGLRSKCKIASNVTGTRVRFWPDPLIFGSAEICIESLHQRAMQTAFLVPGLRVNIEDRVLGKSSSYLFEGGCKQFVEHLSAGELITDVLCIRGKGSFSEAVPVLKETGNLVISSVERVCDVDIALAWRNDFETHINSFVNVIETPKGGTHYSGFEQALLKTIRNAVSSQSRYLKSGNNRPEREDVFSGLTALVSVKLPEPQFEGQTKEVLGTPAVKGIVANIVADNLQKLFEDPKYKTQIRRVLEKVVAQMHFRLAARASRETQRRKNALETSSLPAKLVDCRSNDVNESELFIVEGDSALGTARRARNSEYQALLPIRGKILNVQKASVADALANAECASIIQVIGAGSGSNFDIAQARYGKVIIMSDADVDGAHIRILLLTLFFRYMQPMISSGRVFSALPPLHRVVVKNSNEKIYTRSDRELEMVLSRLKQEGLEHREPIQRYKGLGEMDADQLAETTMDRSKRTLLRIRMSDAQQASDIFALLMGNDVAPRREFIANSVVSTDRIDS
ncbi:DNA gyrase/topoisomerase IV subunit B [Tropheryma whipplei]|uniref:DNA gyrase/topoisomerase IV subunit B n=1 Tax=Tropheryma whipplei TaxID=2039 RepID=UPI0004B5635A|nr:DNA topoisomerase IV subunit B [Tropheryma whipplei]